MKRLGAWSMSDDCSMICWATFIAFYLWVLYLWRESWHHLHVYKMEFSFESNKTMSRRHSIVIVMRNELQEKPTAGKLGHHPRWGILVDRYQSLIDGEERRRLRASRVAGRHKRQRCGRPALPFPILPHFEINDAAKISLFCHFLSVR